MKKSPIEILEKLEWVIKNSNINNIKINYKNYILYLKYCRRIGLEYKYKDLSSIVKSCSIKSKSRGFLAFRIVKSCFFIANC